MTTAEQLMFHFESLGDNCELGFVQRHYGAEPLGLFRFSNPKPDKILHGLQTNFRDLGRNLHVELDWQSKREWIVTEPDYNLRQHTFIFEGDADEAEMTRQQTISFNYLRRRLLEDIKTAEKIFVIKAVPNLQRHQVGPIARMLRRRGPNWLLWVVAGPNPGHVEIIFEGLLRGQIDILRAEGDPQFVAFSYANWLSLMQNAWTLVQSLKQSHPNPETQNP